MVSTQSRIEHPFWDDYLQDIPLCRSLVDNFEQIKTEIRTFVQEKDPLLDFPKYAYYDEIAKIERKELYEHSWKAMPVTKFINEFDDIHVSMKDHLVTMARYVQENLPFTYQLLKEYEEKDWLANSFISKLSPKSVIHPHTGRTTDFLRVHLCILEDPRCSITVGTESKCWKEGKLLAFKDGGPYQHSVIHKGKADRLILSFDLLISQMRQFIPIL